MNSYSFYFPVKIKLLEALLTLDIDTDIELIIARTNIKKLVKIIENDCYVCTIEALSIATDIHEVLTATKNRTEHRFPSSCKQYF